MSQSRKMSMFEIVTSTGIGLVLSLISNVIIFHAMGKEMTLGENIQMTMYFTVISIVRGFGVRRLFNWMDERKVRETLKAIESEKTVKELNEWEQSCTCMYCSALRGER